MTAMIFDSDGNFREVSDWAANEIIRLRTDIKFLLYGAEERDVYNRRYAELKAEYLEEP